MNYVNNRLDANSRDNSVEDEVFGERLYRDAFHNKQKHERLVQDYLNTSCTFRPQINQELKPKRKNK